MGLFLQVALFPGSDVAVSRAAVEQTAQTGNYDLNLKACQYIQTGEGTQAFLAGELGFEYLAEEISRACCAPVLLLYIYDGDFWGYDYYFAGKEVDHFSSCPDYFGEDKNRWERLAGKPLSLIGTFPIQHPESIIRYFPLHMDNKPTAEELAYPGDQYPYGDCWQMTDFMAKLGFPWAFVSDDPPGMQPQPTLSEILRGNLPPTPFEWHETIPLAGSLPTVLSKDYIQGILGQTGFEAYANKTPQEIMEARREAKVTFGNRQNFEYVEPRLCILSAYCALWLGNPGVAFWELYEAVGKGTENIRLLRARGMSVPQFSKRHIAIKDLNQLMELDPENQDIYLLCRAYLSAMLGQKVAQARDDLTVLDRLGTLRENDPRLNFSAFDALFLSEPEEFFRREGARETQRLEGLINKFDETKRLNEEKTARRLQLIMEKRRKKDRG